MDKEQSEKRYSVIYRPGHEYPWKVIDGKDGGVLSGSPDEWMAKRIMEVMNK